MNFVKKGTESRKFIHVVKTLYLNRYHLHINFNPTLVPYKGCLTLSNVMFKVESYEYIYDSSELFSILKL